MISIEFYEGQGLGNQLWVYVVARCIAKHRGWKFSVQSPHLFKGKDFLAIDFGVPDCMPPQYFFKEKMFQDSELEYFAIDFDSGIHQISANTKIEGYFQSEKYFLGFDDMAREVVPFISSLKLKPLVDENACVVNIRGGEYCQSKHLKLPHSYWHKAIDNMRTQFPNIKDVVIVTDDPRYASSILPGLHIISGSISDCYVALNQAKYLIVSNSSFSYFPIKTSVHNPFVIAPMHWARFDNAFNRWASPANYYPSWNYQNQQGVLVSPQECQADYEASMNFYNSFNVLTGYDPTSCHKRSVVYFSKLVVPKPIKTFLKKFISR